MFPLTHVYFYSTIFPVSNGGVLGSVFPDTTLLTGMKWASTHKMTLDLFNRAKNQKDPAVRSFILGLMTHGVDSLGLDYYGDEEYKPGSPGYAYIKSRPLIEDVIRVCGIPAHMGPWKAHNFIEMGIESLVARKEPRLEEWVSNARHDVRGIDSISGMLGEYYSLEPSVFKKGMIRFIDFLQPSGSPEDLASSYCRVLRVRHQIQNLPVEDVSRLIYRARDLIRDEYEFFLDECREGFLCSWPGICREGPWKNPE